MKYIFIAGIAIFFGTNQAIAQNAFPRNGGDSLLSYAGTVQVPGASKLALFIRARDWLGDNLQNLQIQDKETGEVSAKGSVEGEVTFRVLGPRTANATFNFNMNIWVKDGAFSYSINHISNTSITYNDITLSAKNDVSAPVGFLYVSDRAKSKVIGLSQAKSNGVYQSAKKNFEKISGDYIPSLLAAMNKSSTPDF